MEFYNQNLMRRFPFSDDSDTRADIAGSAFSLPDSVFADIRLVLDRPRPAGPVTLVSVRAAATALLCVFDIGGTPAEIEVDAAVPASGRYWVSRGESETEGLSWLVVFGPGLGELMDALGTEAGVFNNPPALVAGTVSDFSRSRVISIEDADGVKTSDAVRLREGYNCAISVTPGSVSIAAVSGHGKGQPCTGTTGCADVLFSVNGARGQDLEVSGGPGVTVTPIPEAHTIDIKGTAGDEC